MAEFNARNVVYGRAWLATVVLAFKTDPGAALVVAGKLRLGTDPGLLITPDTTLAELAAQEATFQGYPPGGVAAALSNAVNVGDKGVALIQNAVFIAAGGAPLTQNTGCNWWIDNGADMVVGEVIPEADRPQFAANGDYLDLLAVLVLGFRQAAA